MTSMRGVVVKGFGEATSTLTAQLPHFAPLFPEVAHCYAGSINVQLEEGLRVFSPDFETQPIRWSEKTEVFGFLRIAFEGPIGSRHQPAWIYIPHLSPHYYNPFCIEVIAQKLDGIAYGTICRVHIAKQCKQTTVLVV